MTVEAQDELPEFIYDWLEAATNATSELAAELDLVATSAGETSSRVPNGSPGAFVPLVSAKTTVQVGLVAEDAACRQLAARALGSDSDNAPMGISEVADVLGELASTIAGAVQARMQQSGESSTLGLPLFMSGHVERSGLTRVVGADYLLGTIPVRVVLVQQGGIAQTRRELGLRTKELEEAILARNAAAAFNEAIVESAPYAIITIDQRGRIEAWNPGAEKILGYTHAEAVGQPISMIMGPKHAAKHDQYIREYLSGKPSDIIGRSREVTAVDREGRVVPLELHVTALKFGRTTSFTAIAKDLSSLKRVQQEVEEVHSELMVMSRKAGIAEASANLLHNIGNVLSSVFASLDVAERCVRESRTDKLQRVGKMLADNAENLGEFFSRPPGSKIPGFMTMLGEHAIEQETTLLAELYRLRERVQHISMIIKEKRAARGAVEPVDLEWALNTAIEVSAHRVRTTTIEVVRQFEPMGPVTVEKHKLLQILINLLSNACDAVRARPSPRIVVRLEPVDENWVKIEVQDNGMGMTSETMERVFAHGFTTKKEGSGFGLHSSANAAKELGAVLQCDSEGPERGATFRLELPLRSATANAA